jgi:hypothetical protein
MAADEPNLHTARLSPSVMSPFREVVTSAPSRRLSLQAPQSLQPAPSLCPLHTQVVPTAPSQHRPRPCAPQTHPAPNALSQQLRAVPPPLAHPRTERPGAVFLLPMQTQAQPRSPLPPPPLPQSLPASQSPTHLLVFARSLISPMWRTSSPRLRP